MDSFTHSSLTFDTFEMTAHDIAVRRGQLELDGWLFSHEIPVHDTFKRVHVHLLFKRPVQASEYPVEDIAPSSGFKETNKPTYEARPRRGGAYYALTLVVVFSLFIWIYALLDPKQEGVTVGTGVAVDARELVLPSSVKANSNTVRGVPVKRRKPPRRISQNEVWRDAGSGGISLPR